MRQKKGPLLSLNRLETLTDSIFAIIITIMVLSLHVPEIPVYSTSMELLDALRLLVPQVISYSISFFLIAHFWLSHIHQLKMCVCTNKIHVLLVFIFIFFVSFIPFTTALVGQYSEIRMAVAVFHSSVLFVYIVSLISWYVVSTSENLISQNIDAKQIRYENTIHVFRLSIPILGIVLSIWEPMYSYFVYGVLILGTKLIQKNIPDTFSSCATK
jgi:uncharacterized membrane protein